MHEPPEGDPMTNTRLAGVHTAHISSLRDGGPLSRAFCVDLVVARVALADAPALVLYPNPWAT
jgi:hypothetical protein